MGFPQNNSKWCGNRRTAVTILLTYLLCPVVCTPLYLSLKISTQEVGVNAAGKIITESPNGNTTTATIYLTSYESEVLKLIGFYVYGVVIKLIPCILLTLLSSLLIVKLLEAKKRIRNLRNPVVKEESKVRTRQKHLEKEKQADRTTKMLLAVLLLFLMVEFPQAILGLLNHIIGNVFEKECYRPLGQYVFC